MAMTSWYVKLTGRFVGALLVTGLLWTVTGTAASAQVVSSDQIIKALTPVPITRGLGGQQQPALSDSDRAFIESLRHRTRSLTVDEDDHVAELAKNSAKIDLEIYFDFDSAAITAKAEPQLSQLGDALRNAQLEKSVIVLSGHTDAKGSDDYNQSLSERRAEAVKKYLVDKLSLSADNLSTAGYGRRNLKNKDNPFAAENRRVQIVNLSSANQAQQ
jgi:outer membrane protein OmpA-like peptidoglycan-associated protein